MTTYKGYTAGPIDFDPGVSVFSGTVVGPRDLIHFEGWTANVLEKSCRDSVDSYLALCAERGEAPDRPLNGKSLLRTAPELHHEAVLSATTEGIILSQWISRQIELA